MIAPAPLGVRLDPRRLGRVARGHGGRFDSFSVFFLPVASVTSIRSIELTDITPAMARASGFEGVVDLLKVAKHGPGRNVYLIGFKYVAPA